MEMEEPIGAVVVAMPSKPRRRDTNFRGFMARRAKGNPWRVESLQIKERENREAKDDRWDQED